MEELSAAKATLQELETECVELAEESASKKEQLASKELMQSKAAAELGLPRAPSLDVSELPQDFRKLAAQDRKAVESTDQRREEERQARKQERKQEQAAAAAAAQQQAQAQQEQQQGEQLVAAGAEKKGKGKKKKALKQSNPARLDDAMASVSESASQPASQPASRPASQVKALVHSFLSGFNPTPRSVSFLRFTTD